MPTRLFAKRKYCEAMMDDLLLFTLTKNKHMAKSEDFLNITAHKLTKNISLRDIGFL